MKRYFYFLFMGLFTPIMLNAQTIRTIPLEYKESDFDFVEIEDYVYLSTGDYTTILKNDTLAPALPYICLNVLIGPDESYIDFSSNSTETLIREGITIAPNPIEDFTNKNVTAPPSSYPLIYAKSTYPDMNIEYTGTHITNGYKFLTFLVCPFRYDSTNRKLYFYRQINLNIQLKTSIKNNLTLSAQKQKGKGCFFINEEHKELLYGKFITNQPVSKSYSSQDQPYRYLIITSNALKDEFERLAQWKSIKGVKAKVLTVEDIYSNDTHADRSNQLKIKYAIKDYYQPYNNGIKYVLLGGDSNHVPVEMCHLQCVVRDELLTDITPADIYYSSFNSMEWDNDHDGRSAELVDDSVDLSLDVAITRLPARYSYEANKMVSRIIDYERNASSNNWDNSMLLCGVMAFNNTTVNGRIVSDAEMQTNTMYNNYISPNWSGTVFRFYDTFTDYSSVNYGANYDVSSNNLQSELSKGYSFAFVNTHGNPNSWEMETYASYDNNKASTLINPHYTILSTSACETNHFDQSVPCLGEAFMQNGNGGILAYYGCSRKSFGSILPSSLGTDMNFIGTFYQKLFHTYSNQCLGEAIRDSKNMFLSNINNYNSTRWMYLALNAFGDPEMPVYKTVPTAIPNVTINYDGSNLTVNSGVERPMLCLMSRYDEGNSFYRYQFGNGTPPNESNTFTDMNGEYSYCLTKKGYLPTLAVIGNTVHLQNETFTGKNNVISYHTLIGSNVTSLTSEGAVTIESGSTVITSHNDVIITGEFEVKLGAELEINISSQNQVNL